MQGNGNLLLVKLHCQNYINMKVLHSGSLDVKSGGPALSTYLTLKGLGKEGIAAEMIMSPLNKKGKTKMYNTLYRRFKTNSWTEKNTNLKEILFICKVKI